MKTTACLAGVLAATLLVGCNSTNNVSYKSITSNPNPELRGLATRPADAHNAFALASSQNLRMFNDDLARTFYTNHPSRLSPFPIMYTSGQPN